MAGPSSVIKWRTSTEAGSYSACERDNTGWLRDFIRSRLGSDIVLFTTGGAGNGFLQCGKVPKDYATVDFWRWYNLFKM